VNSAARFRFVREMKPGDRVLTYDPATREYLGWETPSMVQRYAHLSPAHLAHRAKLLDGLIDTNSAQQPNA